MRTIRPSNLRRRTLGTATILIALFLALSSPAYAANPAPVQIYYLSLPEADALTVLNAVNSDAVSPTYTYFSISIALNDTYVYYDQWEDGYAADMANPTASEIYSASNLDGVQIWGNGESDDGCAPNIAGVAVTCTDVNDVLHRGDVIIPYNAVAVPRAASAQSNVLDNFGTVSYSNNNGNTNWASDWVETGDTASPNYRDEFTTTSYSLSAGSLDWTTTSWTEVGESDGPTTGLVRIDTSQLRFGRGSVVAPVGTALYRAANLSGYTGATLSYSYTDTANEAADAVQVQVRNPVGGSGGNDTWTTLATITGTSGTGTGSHNISAYIDSDTQVRFYVSQQLETNDYIYFDNVNIALTPGNTPTGPASGQILITGGALRFAATDANDSIDRGVSLPTGDGCATLSFTLGQSGIDASDDRLAVQVSIDGGANYTTLATYTSSADAGAKSYPIANYAAANTRVRFISLDALETGEYWTVDDAQVTWNCTLPVLFDAKDKIGASNPIAMARAVWASVSGTLNAFAHELYPAVDWGTAYEAPVGTNTASPGTDMFEYSGLAIMASQANTQVQIDANADGTYETTVTLQEGGTYLATGTSQGARVQTDKPVQVILVTGDVGSNYETRDINLLPVSAYGSSYWSPVGVSTGNGTTTPGPTRLWLYNPSANGSIYITCERAGVANTTLGPVAARGVVTVDLTDNQGGHCFASTSGGVATTNPIFGIGTVDTASAGSGQAWDWSFTLFPDNFLTTDALVGLGLGKDPTDASSTQDGSPVWVTPTCDTYVYADWNNDGTADLVDLNGDGDTADTVNGISESTSSSGMWVTKLKSVRLFEPGLDTEPYDQSGARVWSRTASGVGYGGTAGCNLAAAWGEDPRVASASNPGLDVGTSVPPLRLVSGAKALSLKSDNDGDGQLSPGDLATYHIIVRNVGPTDVDAVYVYDTVPANTTYVVSTTKAITATLAWFDIADDPAGDHYPLDDTTLPLPNGVFIGNNMLPGETYTVTFDILLGQGVSNELILNCDTAFTEGGNVGACATNYVASKDWGDLPDSYGTSQSTDGPRHAWSGLTLGGWFDYDPQGQPDPDADGDDANETTNPQDDDEDGVTIAGTAAQWDAGSGTFTTVISGTGCLNAWMDFTNDIGSGAGLSYADGNFTRSSGYDTYGAYSEHIIQNVKVTPATTSVNVSVPAGLFSPVTNAYYFRFRLSPTDGDGNCTAAIAPTGYVVGGEVEDYKFDASPTAVHLLPLRTFNGDASIVLLWETTSEIENVGFNVYRSTAVYGERVRLNAEMIPSHVAPGSPFGAAYEYEDKTAKPGKVYYYWVEDVDIFGKAGMYGPVDGKMSNRKGADVPPNQPTGEVTP